MRKGTFAAGIMFHKQDVRCVKGRIRDRKRRLEPQHARIKYWTRRGRLRIKCAQIHKQICISEEEIPRIARNFSDFRLPFLAATCDGHDLSNET
jgi:hypothetical protein